LLPSTTCFSQKLLPVGGRKMARTGHADSLSKMARAGDASFRLGR